MRKVIIDERAMNPKYYDKMSELLDALIEERRQGAIDYKQYLEQLIAQAPAARQAGVRHRLPRLGGQRRQARARRLRLPERGARHRRSTARSGTPSRTSWVGNRSKEKKVQLALVRRSCPTDFDRLDELFELVKARDEYR